MTLITVSLVLSWIAIVVLAIMVLALTRQIGILHERISPAGALSIEKHGLHTGEAAPQFKLNTLAGREIQVGGAQASGKSTLLFFLSETCPVCKLLIPVLRSVQKDEAGWLDIVLASDGDDTRHRAFVETTGLQDFDYLLSEELGRGFEIAKLPYGVLIDEQGTLLAHGLVNTREHLESFIEARRLGVSTVQEYVGRNAA